MKPATLSGETLDQLVRAVEVWRALPHRFARWDGDRALEDAIAADSTGITAVLVFDGIVSDYASSVSVTAEELLENPEKVQNGLTELRKLKDLGKNPEVAHLRTEFRRRLRSVAETFGGATAAAKVDSLTDYTLANANLNARRAMDKMEVHQFAQGAAGDGAFHLNQWVHEFVNVNSLVAAMGNQPMDGVTLVLIRNREIEEYSQFCFAVRNGNTLTLLVDREQFYNPEQQHLRRGPGKDFARRLADSWLPWDLLGIRAHVDQHGSVREVTVERGTSHIVPFQVEAVRLARVEDLDADRFTWLILMADRLHERFFIEKRLVPALSYTNEMIRIPDALPAACAELARTDYQALELPALTPSDVDSDKVAGLYRITPTKHNQWMEDRYACKVNPSVYNVLLGETTPALLGDGRELPQIESHEGFGKMKTYEPKFLRADGFGTAESIKKDRLWYARHNRAVAIQALADAEFEATQEEIKEWVRTKVTANVAQLKRAIVDGKFNAPSLESEGFTLGWTEKTRDILTVVDRSDDTVPPHFFFSNFVLSSGRKDGRGPHCCIERPGTPGQYIAFFSPNCPKALALLCGVAVEEMPLVLQHWTNDSPYCGNFILDDTDPLEHELRNPWMEMKLRVALFFCKSTLNRWKKAAGLHLSS
jgi:hypothetical protein